MGKNLSYSPPPAADNTVLTITSNPINLVQVLSQGHHPQAGAVVLFSGEARNHNQGKSVSHLYYEAYIPIATQTIQQIIADATTKYKLLKATCIHRIGQVHISEPAVAIVTSAPHRAEAYAASRYIIDRVKHEAPIWKQEFFQDGTSQWGHNCQCSQPHPHHHTQ